MSREVKVINLTMEEDDGQLVLCCNYIPIASVEAPRALDDRLMDHIAADMLRDLFQNSGAEVL